MVLNPLRRISSGFQPLGGLQARPNPFSFTRPLTGNAPHPGGFGALKMRRKWAFAFVHLC